MITTGQLDPLRAAVVNLRRRAQRAQIRALETSGEEARGWQADADNCAGAAARLERQMEGRDDKVQKA
jgi:hypothetical protein